MDALGQVTHRRLRRAVGVCAGLLVLGAATLVGLLLAKAPPFSRTVQVPAVLNMTDDLAVTRLVQGGLNARVIWRRKSIGRGQLRHVYAESPAAGRRLQKGSTVTLYVEIPFRWSCATPTGPCPMTYFYKAVS